MQGRERQAPVHAGGAEYCANRDKRTVAAFVHPDVELSLRLDARRQALKCPRRLRRVMDDAVTPHQIKLRLPKRQSQNICLHNVHVRHVPASFEGSLDGGIHVNADYRPC